METSLEEIKDVEISIDRNLAVYNATNSYELLISTTPTIQNYNPYYTKPISCLKSKPQCASILVKRKGLISFLIKEFQARFPFEPIKMKREACIVLFQVFASR